MAAIQSLPGEALAEVARSSPVFESFGERDRSVSAVESLRLHSMAVRATTELLARTLRLGSLDELITAALVHDFGRVALAEATAGGHPARTPATPEARYAAEREHLGADHAQVGAEIAAGWGFSPSLSDAIGGHHTATTGTAAVIRVADMLAHYGQNHPVDVTCLARVGEQIGLDRATLGRLVFQLPLPIAPPRRDTDECPLSAREVEIIGRLAAGLMYKEIAMELGIAASTVRNHLHRIYRRIGAADRTQAVLVATERGWI
jgi:putative nucleotidyltransferase with HDIG domain